MMCIFDEARVLRGSELVLQQQIKVCCSGRVRRCLTIARPNPADAPVITIVWDIFKGARVV